MVDYYEILQVSPNAELEIIEAAYKRLALKYHPDTNQSPAASDRMKWINQAFTVLSDTEQRAEYDKARQNYRPTSPAASPVAASPAATSPAPSPTPPPPAPSKTPVRPPARPHRLRACLTVILFFAVVAAALWALQWFNLFPVQAYIPPIPYQLILPPTSTPVP